MRSHRLVLAPSGLENGRRVSASARLGRLECARCAAAAAAIACWRSSASRELSTSRSALRPIRARRLTRQLRLAPPLPRGARRRARPAQRAGSVPTGRARRARARRTSSSASGGVGLPRERVRRRVARPARQPLSRRADRAGRRCRDPVRMFGDAAHRTRRRRRAPRTASSRGHVLRAALDHAQVFVDRVRRSGRVPAHAARAPEHARGRSPTSSARAFACDTSCSSRTVARTEHRACSPPPRSRPRARSPQLGEQPGELALAPRAARRPVPCGAARDGRRRRSARTVGQPGLDVGHAVELRRFGCQLAARAAASPSMPTSRSASGHQQPAPQRRRPPIRRTVPRATAAPARRARRQRAQRRVLEALARLYSCSCVSHAQPARIDRMRSAAALACCGTLASLREYAGRGLGAGGGRLARARAARCRRRRGGHRRGPACRRRDLVLLGGRQPGCGSRHRDARAQALGGGVEIAGRHLAPAVELVGDAVVELGAEQLGQQGAPLVVVGPQEPHELALRQQHDLGELVAGQTEVVGQHLADLVLACGPADPAAALEALEVHLRASRASCPSPRRLGRGYSGERVTRWRTPRSENSSDDLGLDADGSEVRVQSSPARRPRPGRRARR